MLSTYLKLILLSTILLNASPKAFDSLGNELENFQKACKDLQAISLLPSQIKKHCDVYISNVHKAFKVGYKLDHYIDTDNLNETHLNKYLELLRQSDEKKSTILRLILLEKKKAREKNNFTYYSQLIANDNVKLFHSDYEFMEKNIEVFAQNDRYLTHIRYLKSLEEERQANLELENKREEERKRQEEKARKVAKLKMEKELKEIKFFNSKAEQIKRLSIDYIELPVPNINKEYLEFIITYHNRDIGDIVTWKDGSAKINCKAYAKNGHLLGSLENKEVQTSYQQIYVKLDTIASTGTLKCNVDFLGKIYDDTIMFGGYRDLLSPTFSNRHNY